MDEVTVEQVKEAIATHNIERWTLRTCGLCDAPLDYIFQKFGTFYDSNCDCTSRWVTPEERSLESVVETFNRQTPDIRKSMWDKFIASGESNVART